MGVLCFVNQKTQKLFNFIIVEPNVLDRLNAADDYVLIRFAQ